MIDSHPLRTAVRECLSDVIEGLPPARKRPTFSVRVANIARHEQTPSEGASTKLYRVSVVVRAAYTLDANAEPQANDDIRSDAESDAYRFAQALGRPGAVARTRDEQPTGLVSGLLRAEGSAVKREPASEELHEVETTFAGIVLVETNAS